MVVERGSIVGVVIVIIGRETVLFLDGLGGGGGLCGGGGGDGERLGVLVDASKVRFEAVILREGLLAIPTRG